jgi:NitT/TauT family transport system substrate-binding protein
VVEIAFPNMLSALEDKKIDLATMLVPFSIAAHRQGNLKTLFTMRQVVGLSQTIMWTMKADFIKAHRPALVDFFEDHIRGVRWLLDPGNRAAALAIASSVTKQKPEDLAYAFTHADFYHSPDCVPDMAAAQKEVDMSVQFGLLPRDVTFSPVYVDLSLIEDAKRRIDGR